MGYISDAANAQKEALSEDIERLEHKIREYSEAYDSLIKFRSTVSYSQGDFNTANSHRRTILKDLNPVNKDNTVVKKYQSGMGDQLTGIGMQVVDVAFFGLQGMITLKLTEYWNTINALKLEKSKKELDYYAIDIVV